MLKIGMHLRFASGQSSMRCASMTSRSTQHMHVAELSALSRAREAYHTLCDIERTFCIEADVSAFLDNMM